MIKRDWTVKEEGLRPPVAPNHCYYCGEQRGQNHKSDCVVRCRTVVVKTTFTYVVAVPECWEPYNIEFKFNESSSCADNIVDTLSNLVERLNSEVCGSCICGLTHTEFVREATPEDEERNKLFAVMLPG